MKDFVNQFSFILFFFLSFSTNNILASEISKIEDGDYKKLCSIYKNVLSHTYDLSSKEMLLTEKVQNELPELFNNLFLHITKVNSNGRYKLVKDYAQQQNNVVWECDSAKKYYANTFR